MHPHTPSHSHTQAQPDSRTPATNIRTYGYDNTISPARTAQRGIKSYYISGCETRVEGAQHRSATTVWIKFTFITGCRSVLRSHSRLDVCLCVRGGFWRGECSPRILLRFMMILFGENGDTNAVTVLSGKTLARAGLRRKRRRPHANARTAHFWAHFINFSGENIFPSTPRALVFDENTLPNLGQQRVINTKASHETHTLCRILYFAWWNLTIIRRLPWVWQVFWIYFLLYTYNVDTRIFASLFVRVNFVCARE